jgi:hypothetical protein
MACAENKPGGGAAGVRKEAHSCASVILHFIFTSADEILSWLITIHRLVFPIFMHQNALIYTVIPDLTLVHQVARA